MILKKAAMFGLDARIALAIFGALSVISGAALYSAISKAKATAYITEVSEYGKAWEQYMLDTGFNLPQNDSVNSNNLYYYRLQPSYLVEDNNIIGWKGPYLSLDVDGYRLVHKEYGKIYFLTLTDEVEWGGLVNYDPVSFCQTGQKCYLWIMVNGIPDNKLAKNIDALVDNSDGAGNGSFRWYNTENATHKYDYYFKYSVIKNPNN